MRKKAKKKNNTKIGEKFYIFEEKQKVEMKLSFIQLEYNESKK